MTGEVEALLTFCFPCIQLFALRSVPGIRPSGPSSTRGASRVRAVVCPVQLFICNGLRSLADHILSHSQSSCVRARTLSRRRVKSRGAAPLHRIVKPVAVAGVTLYHVPVSQKKTPQVERKGEASSGARPAPRFAPQPLFPSCPERKRRVLSSYRPPSGFR